MSGAIAAVRVLVRVELAIVTLAGWLALLAIPLTLGQIGISWDALNHHIYLGWTAETPRFGRDYLAASFQSFQFPYLYWPVYKLAASGVSGATAGAVLATLHATAIPALWLIARRCIPGPLWTDAILRALAVVLGFSSVLVLSMFDSTSNDLLSTVPMVWSLAFALHAMQHHPAPRMRPSHAVALSGLMAGVSVACKLSNGPTAILTPLIWWFAVKGLRGRAGIVAVGSVAALLGFAITYGYWGWQLWVHVGNPVYPFADPYFEPLRRWMDWKG